MCNYPLDTKPLFATIDTEYLDQLHEGQRLLQSLTISRDNLTLIADSLHKARTKHPKFCDKIINDVGVEEAEFFESLLKHDNEFAEVHNTLSAESILKEEVAEMCTEVEKGNKHKAKEEAADCIAVLVRIMEELEK